MAQPTYQPSPSYQRNLSSLMGNRTVPSFQPAPTQPVKTTTPVSGSTAPVGATTWKTGDRISHRVFGCGTVQQVYHDPVTENDKIEIAFDGVGTKTLLLSHAKLERLD